MDYFKSLKEKWFTSSEREDILKVISGTLNTMQESIEALSHKAEDDVRLYKSRRKIGDNTIVVLNDGVPLTIKDEDGAIYNEIPYVKTEAELLTLFSPEPAPKTVTEKIASKDLNIFRDAPDFELKGENVYMKGVSLRIPEVVVADFAEVLEKLKRAEIVLDEFDYYSKEVTEAERVIEELEDRYNRLKFFWLKLANSPVKDRDNVLAFCKDNDIRLSPTGNIIGYRRVNKYGSIPTLIHRSVLETFIIDSYNKVKGWKKSPANYTIYKGENKDEYQLTLGTPFIVTPDVVGILSDLYNGVKDKVLTTPTAPTQQMYTSAHNAGKYVFAIGDVYRMEGEEPDSNVGNCASGGLHGAAVNYNYSGFGDTPIVVLINPAKAIYVPTYETGKFRTTEMKLACVNPNPHGVHIDESLILEADKEYNEFTISELKNILATKSFATVAIQEQVPEVNLLDIQTIINSLENKVVNI